MADAARRVDPRVELLDSPHDVHILLHTAPAKSLPSDDSRTSGTGRTEATTFELSAPLSGRRLLSNQRIPPTVVTLLPNSGRSGPTLRRPA